MQAKALQLTDAFSIDALEYRDIQVPSPAAGEVLVRVRAVSLNYRDLMVVRGEYNPNVKKPLTLCSDCCGEVVEVGSDVQLFKPGERVVCSFFLDWTDGPIQQSDPAPSALGEAQQGVLCTYRTLPARALVILPEALSFAEGSTFPCAGVTAWHALTQYQPVDSESTVLIEGTGGVSIFGLQIAHALGSRTIVTSSSDEKLERAATLGADDRINYRTTPQWDRAVLERTAKRGSTHVLEVGGAGTLPLAVRAAGRGALVAVIGVLSGGEQPFSIFPLLMKNLHLQGIYVGSTEMLQALLRFYDMHGLRPVVDRVFSFEQAKDAFKSMAAADHFGKLVITLDA